MAAGHSPALLDMRHSACGGSELSTLVALIRAGEAEVPLGHCDGARHPHAARRARQAAPEPDQAQRGHLLPVLEEVRATSASRPARPAVHCCRQSGNATHGTIQVARSAVVQCTHATADMALIPLS